MIFTLQEAVVDGSFLFSRLFKNLKINLSDKNVFFNLQYKSMSEIVRNAKNNGLLLLLKTHLETQLELFETSDYFQAALFLKFLGQLARLFLGVSNYYSVTTVIFKN
jgi:hypothetical protein